MFVHDDRDRTNLFTRLIVGNNNKFIFLVLGGNMSKAAKDIILV